MKRKTLTTAIIAGLTGVAGMVGVANAVNVNPDGLGQVLIYPYYTARGGNDTLISVVNTSSQAKSTKVRFLEGLNSREVLDFNLYLSAFDVWTAAITVEDDGAKLLTADTSCTVPYIFGSGGEQRLLDFEFTGENEDGATTDEERVRSGYIEIIETGTVFGDTREFGLDQFGDQVLLGFSDENIDPTGAVVSTFGSEYALTHVDKFDEDGNFVTREPRDCGQLVQAWTTTNFGAISPLFYWSRDRFVDHVPSGGGSLFGSASIINVEEGTMFSYNSVPIDNWTADVEHTAPGLTTPTIVSGSVETSAVFRSAGQDVDQQTWDSNAEAVNAVLMNEKVLNEYAINPALGGLTEWVFTFPTKRFHVDPLAGLPQVPLLDDGGDPVEDDDGDIVLTDEAIPPFSVVFDGESCEPVDFRFWDREELQPGPQFGLIPPIVSPAPPVPDTEISTFDLCFEANIIRFAASDAAVPDQTEILGERRFTTFPLESRWRAGWAEFDFSPELIPAALDFPDTARIQENAAGTAQYVGLPVVGFSVNTFSNGALETDAGVVQSNYGGSFVHRGSRRIELTESTVD